MLKCGYLVIWLFLFAAGLVLYLRNDALSRRRELGAALILLGAWGIPNTLAQRFFDHFRPAFADLLLTVAVAGYVAVRWQRVDGPLATRLVALLVFTWLVAGRGDPLERLGSLLTLPEVVVIVFGVVFTLLSDSSFASATSTNFPRDSRPLLWIGFLIFSASVSNFIAATHGRDITRLSETVGFHYLAIPLAAWLVIRRRFAPAATEPARRGPLVAPS